MSASVRKNFVLDATVAQHLEELAKENNQSMTSLVEEMVEERYGSIRVKKRLEAFHRSQALSESFNGVSEGKTIQQIKAEKSV